MYTDVHMNVLIPITDFRKNIFSLTDRLVEDGGEVLIEKDGKTILKVIPVEQTAREQAKKLLSISRKLIGKIKIDHNNDFFRGKKEIRYLRQLGA